MRSIVQKKQPCFGMLTFRGRSLALDSRRRSYDYGRDQQEDNDETHPSGRVEFSLANGLNRAGCSKVVRVASLNKFVRYLRLADSVVSDFNIPLRDLFVCLRPLLVDEECEIRICGLRSVRHLLRSEADAKIALELGIDHLVVRSFETSMNDESERLQCLQLFVLFVNLFPAIMPSSFLNALLSIASSSFPDEDNLGPVGLALLCELAIKRVTPRFPGNYFLSCVARYALQCQTPSQIQCLSNLTGHLFNDLSRSDYPVIKRSVFFHELMTALIDSDYERCGQSEKPTTSSWESNRSNSCLSSCRTIMVCNLRHWSGILHTFAQVKTPISCGNPVLGIVPTCSPIESLLLALRMESEDVQETAVEILCELLGVDYADKEFLSWTEVLDYRMGHFSEDSDHMLSQQFVLADGKAVSQEWNDSRMDLVDATIAIVLYCLLKSNQVKVLAEKAISDPDRPLHLKITLLIEDILYRSYRWLPANTSEHSSSIDTLYCCGEDERTQNQAVTLSNRVDLLRIARQRRVPKSLMFELLFNHYNSHGLPDSSIFSTDIPTSSDHVAKVIRDSRVLVNSDNPESWNWLLVDLVLTEISFLPKFYSDPSYIRFIIEVLGFFKLSGQFRRLNSDFRSYSRVGCKLVALLCRAPCDSLMRVQLREFLNQITGFLPPENLENGPLGERELQSSAAIDYFAMILQLSFYESGLQELQQAGILSRFEEILATGGREIYVKVILASLSFEWVSVSPNDPFWRILRMCLTSCCLESRLYATHYVVMLGQMRLDRFVEWGMSLLTDQLNDSSAEVVKVAMEGLHSLLIDSDYRAAFVQQNTPLLTYGNAGILLMSYRYSEVDWIVSSSAAMLGCLCEIDRWKDTFYVRYYEICEEMLSETFNNYNVFSDGSFPMRSSSGGISCAFMPPHLFGHLAEHQLGCYLLYTQGVLSILMENLHDLQPNTEGQQDTFAATLYALGQIGCRDAGMMLLPLCVVPAIVRVAEQCNMCHIRGCAYYAISLISKNYFGSGILSLLGWNSAVVKMALSLSEFKRSRHEFVMKLKDEVQYWRHLIAESTSMKQALFTCTEVLSACRRALPLSCAWCRARNEVLHILTSDKELVGLLAEEYSMPVAPTEVRVLCCKGSSLSSGVNSVPCNVNQCGIESVDSLGLLFRKDSFEPKWPVKSALQGSKSCQTHSKSGLGQALSLPVSEAGSVLDIPHKILAQRLSFSLDNIQLIRSDVDGLKKNERVFPLRSKSSMAHSGFCLPVSLRQIFSLDEYRSTTEECNVINDDKYDDVCFDEHSAQLCFLCCNSLCLSTFVNSGETSSLKLSVGEVQVRKEALRLISMLSVRVKYSEQGLLRLKQDFRSIISSACFYSDVCIFLSQRSLPLKARRFIQELLADVKFDALWKRAFEILQLLSPVQEMATVLE
uniref:Rapamycin-insensitive companion of mTOR domain-containing protein n=1 Tax=Trichuris muris TaxID=70415 RepID=A0A5S6Q7S4_TRIMR